MSTQPAFGHIPQRTIGRRLRDAREDTGMSQSEFETATGISRRTISRAESTTDPAQIKRPILLSWAFATNVPIEWLQTGHVPTIGGGENGLRTGNTHQLATVHPIRKTPPLAEGARKRSA